MLQELKTLVATCDNCGYIQEYQSVRATLPADWGKAARSENLETRMEEEKDDLCPHCVHSVQNGFKKYARPTLYLF